MNRFGDGSFKITQRRVGSGIPQGPWIGSSHEIRGNGNPIGFHPRFSSCSL